MITTWPDDHLSHHLANAEHTSPHYAKQQDFHKPNLPMRLAFPSELFRFTKDRLAICHPTFFRSWLTRSAYRSKPSSAEVLEPVNEDPSQNSKDNLRPCVNFPALSNSKFLHFWKRSWLITHPLSFISLAASRASHRCRRHWGLSRCAFLSLSGGDSCGGL